MAIDNAKNFAKVTVSTTYDASATSIVLTGGHGAKLPTVQFNATWWNATDYNDPADDPNVEIVRVTAIATDTLTVTRGQEGISASTKNDAGKTYKMLAGLTAKAINTDLAADLATFVKKDGTVTLTGALNFASLKAIAMVCDNGSTFPVSPSPVTGQWFLLVVTGRSVLFQYNGSAWTPIISLGAITIYVDDVSGTDSQALGTATGVSAFLTIQFALNQIPPLYAGNVIINIAAGTYTESFAIRGKTPTGNFTFSIAGVGTTTTSVTITGGVNGSSTTQTTLTGSGSPFSDVTAGSIIKFTSGSNNGLFRVVDTNDGTTITLCGLLLTAAPTTGDTFETYPLSTIVDGNATIASPCVVQDIYFTNVTLGTGGVITVTGAVVTTTITRCRVSSYAASGAGVTINNSAAIFFACTFFSNGNSSLGCVYAQPTAYFDLQGSRVAYVAGTGSVGGIRLASLTYGLVRNHTVITGAFTTAINHFGTVLEFSGMVFIKNAGTGVSAAGAFLLTLASATFSGCTTNIVGWVQQGPFKTSAAYSNNAPGAVGAFFAGSTAIFTDTSTAASGTAAIGAFYSMQIPTYAAVNTGVIVTDCPTHYIAGPPGAGTNVTLTRPWAFWIDAGNARLDGKVNIGQGGVVPTSLLHLGAGTTAAATAPLKLTSGTNMTTAEAGAVEFTTDDFFATITTGAARKAFVLDDGTRLTATRVPFATTNGRLTDDADMTFAVDTLTVAKVVGSTSISSALVISTGAVRLKNYTVATLPAGTQGDKAFVTDALAPTFLATAVGGGAIVSEVFYNGTNWVCT